MGRNFRNQSVITATSIANRVNKELEPIQFIGQFASVSRHLPKDSSVYAEQFRSKSKTLLGKQSMRLEEEPDIVKG